MTIAAYLYAAFLLILGILFAPPIDGRGYFGYALDDHSTIQWQANTCSEGETWQAGIMTAGGLAVLDFAKPGDCVGFERGLNVGWVACCERDGEVQCVGPEVVENLTQPCPVIFKIDGSMFEDGDVARYNAEHGG